MSNQQRGRVMSGLGGSDRGANTIAPFVGGWIAYTMSNRTCLYAQALPPLLAFFATWWFLPGPPLSQSVSDAKAALSQLRCVERLRSTLKLTPTVSYAPVTNDGGDDGGEEEGGGGRDGGGGADDEGKGPASASNSGSGSGSGSEDGAMSTWSLCVAYRSSLSTVTSFATCLTALRVSRQLLLPLAAVDAQLTIDQIGAVTATSYIAE